VSSGERGDCGRGNGIVPSEQDLSEILDNGLADGDGTSQVRGVHLPDVVCRGGPSGLDGKVQDPSLRSLVLAWRAERSRGRRLVRYQHGQCRSFEGLRTLNARPTPRWRPR